jgi:hypothetical protein
MHIMNTLGGDIKGYVKYYLACFVMYVRLQVKNMPYILNMPY